MAIDLSKYLMELRTAKGLSQRQLAEKAGISNTEIWRIESGERKNPTPAILEALAPHLDVTYENLMVKAGYIKETIDHSGFTEEVIWDGDGNLVDITRKTKEMYKTDSRWANTAYRVSKELSKEDIATIQAVADALLNQKK